MTLPVDFSPLLARLVEDFGRLNHRSPNHGSGQAWLKIELEALDRSEACRLLVECVRAMPELRVARRQAEERGINGPLWRAGELAHATAALMFARGHAKLAPSREEVVTILTTAAHDCGHGNDLAGALDLAVAELRKNGADPQVLSGVATWREGLRGLSATKAKMAARKADYVLLADPCAHDGLCWSATFRSHVFSLDDSRMAAWQHLVFSALPTDHLPPPKRFAPVAHELVEAVGINHVLDVMRRSLPTRNATGVRTTGPGSHLMKHLVWLLDYGDADEASVLARQIASLGWATKRETALGQKAVNAARHFLAT